MAFSHAEILEAVKYARRAYGDDWSGVPGTTAFSDRTTDCQCFLTKGEGIAFVTFRGTSSLQDALADCNVRLVTPPFFKDPKVHAGFLRQASAVVPAVLEALEGWRGEIRCTGHSLGGPSTAESHRSSHMMVQ